MRAKLWKSVDSLYCNLFR